MKKKKRKMQIHAAQFWWSELQSAAINWRSDIKLNWGHEKQLKCNLSFLTFSVDKIHGYKGFQTILFDIIIIIIIKSTKYVLDILPLFAGSNMKSIKCNQVYWNWTLRSDFMTWYVLIFWTFKCDAEL